MYHFISFHFIYYESAPRFTIQILNAQDILESGKYVVKHGVHLFKAVTLFQIISTTLVNCRMPW